MNELLKLLKASEFQVCTISSISKFLWSSSDSDAIRKTECWLLEHGLAFKTLNQYSVCDEHERRAKYSVIQQVCETALKKKAVIFTAALYRVNSDYTALFASDTFNNRRWIFLESDKIDISRLESALVSLLTVEASDVVLLPSGQLVKHCRKLIRQWKTNSLTSTKDGVRTLRIALEIYSHSRADILAFTNNRLHKSSTNHMSHLDNLEAESIYIIREVIAEANNPVMLYSVGKDSSVMLHLARKAFYPSTPPFPLLHIDTRWKFQSMYDFRDHMAQESGMELLIHINPEAIEKNINPFEHGSALHTDITKTQGLKQALDHYKFDVAFGGARRDEEKSRAKERVFSFRTSSHLWDPKNQRPEVWHLYNDRKNPGESIRVFPISNWTELDIWQYIYREQIPIVPLYFAQERPVVERDGMLIMIDDDRMKLSPKEKIQIKKIRFRTLGCYPLTGAIESDADDLASVVLELLSSKTSERQGRAIDSDSSASMEKKKQEGYF